MTTAQALAALEQSEKLMLTPAEVAPILGCQAYAINVQAKEDPAKLGFPVCMMGTRVRIPRRAFLHWIKFGNAPILERRDEK